MPIMIRVFQFFLLLFVIVVSYIGIAALFSFFPTTADVHKKEHTIYICHDDAILSHSEIIMMVAPLKEDFFKAFPHLLHNNPRGYISFSYGDRDFMMDKNGFDELNLTLACRALFIDTAALIKVGHYGDFSKERCHKVRVSTSSLLQLKESILDSFAKKRGETIRYHDSFNRYYIYYYRAKEDYNLIHTCNTWSGDRLREAGISTPYWTPFSENITSQLH